MITWPQALILGALQGATEYLPVSSSGHLVIAEHLFGLREPTLLFNIVLHVGTLSAVVVYYWCDIVRLVRESLLGIGDLLRGGKPSRVLSSRPEFRFALLILWATIPTAVIGLLFNESFKRMFASVQWVGLMLIVTGVVLFLTRFTSEKSSRPIGLLSAFVIGTVQGLAIAPGISRSGTTIAAGLFQGIEREEAARFSFLLSIPSIVGALLLEVNGATNGAGSGAMIFGFVAAAVTGYACLALLVQLVKRNRLSIFAVYCLVVGLAALFVR